MSGEQLMHAEAMTTTATVAEPDIARPIALALVGLGRFGATHARCLAHSTNFRLAAVVDTSSMARLQATQLGLGVHESIQDLPATIDAAVVATNDDAHASTALALMRRGCHVLVEKPLAQHPADGHEMVAAARLSGVTLCTGQIERFNPAIDDAALARWRRAAVHHRGSDGLFLRAQRHSGRVAPAIDSVLDLMVHDLDLFAWIGGLPCNAPFDVLERTVTADRVQVRVRLGGLLAELESGYGDAASCARIDLLVGGGFESIDLRAHRHWPTGEDALTRQHRAFHRAISTQAAPTTPCPIADRIASGDDGLAALTRAYQVLHA